MRIQVGSKREDLYYCSAYQKDKKNPQEDKATVNHGTVFVGDMKGTMVDNIFQKKTEAQKKALKIVLDQFARDLIPDDYIKECEDKILELEEEASELQDKLKDFDDLKKNLAEAYGITEDSEEAKNLNLLRKSVAEPGHLSKEEWDQIKSMGPLTDYQKEALQLDADQKTFQDTLNNTRDEITNQKHTVEAIKNETLKQHGMADAQKEALDILMQASEDTIDQLMNEVKDKVDEETKENATKAEETKKEQIEEKKANASSSSSTEQVNQVENSEVVMELSNSTADMTQVQNEIKSMILNKKILEEDIKGLLVDESR